MIRLVDRIIVGHMSQKIYNYIRSHRKRAGLSQEELAFLLGCQSHTKVSRYENLSREPNIQTVFACQAVFQIEARTLFPGMYTKVEHKVITRARMLHTLLQKNGADVSASYKRVFLEKIIANEVPSVRAQYNGKTNR